MVSATNNAVPAGAPSPWAWQVKQPGAVGARDQLTYYSNYGSRVDITAPGGARKFNVPRYDIGNADILYGGWGTLAGIDPSGDLCLTAGQLTAFACFKVNGAGFGWLQGTSMSSPNATGVAALAVAAHPTLAENPDALLSHLQGAARTDMVNHMVRNDTTDTGVSVTSGPCPTGWCHLDSDAPPISFADAYGAGMVDAGTAVSTAP
jgi:subtilisin family serine protease